MHEPMTDKERIKIGKFLAFILRHSPESLGLELDGGGWVDIEELIKKSTKIKLTKEIIEEVVRTDNKQRYKISDDRLMIRASQGHSIDVDLGLVPKKPPVFLYHGTTTRNLDKIKEEGLKKMSRQYVHLSKDEATATKVGQRHGKPVVIMVDAKNMYYSGHVFYLSDNEIWLTDHVPPEFLGHVIDRKGR